MKKTALLFCLLLSLWGCDNKDEHMEYAQIYFPLATRADQNGVFDAQFNFSRDTTFIIGAYCGGSILTPQDINVSIELAENALFESQQSNAAIAAYDLLPSDAYSVVPENMEVIIKKGTERADVKVTFHTSLLDPDKKYILPFRIKSVSWYEISSKYSTLFFGIKKQ